MSEAELKEIKKLIFNTAKYYNREISPEVITMMADDLSDLDFSGVLNAYTIYRRDPKNKSMPLPSQIRDLINPNVSPISEAREILERIKEAISKFGWANGNAARFYIGDVGWNFVNRNGGWSALCESDFLYNHGRQAQARDSIADKIQYGNQLGSSESFTAITYDQSKKYESIDSSENTKILEFDLEKKRQMESFMNKFNLNSEVLKEGEPWKPQ